MIKTHVFQGKENLMEFKIKYYKDLVSFHIPDQNVLGNIRFPIRHLLRYQRRKK